MRRTLIANLRCPATGEALHLEATRLDGDEVLEGRLAADSGRSYAIRDGIASFVDATVLESQTVESFRQKWATHDYYREHTHRFYTDWYLQRYGFLDLAGLRAAMQGVRFALDAGTGAGRDAINLADSSDAVVFAVDTAWDALSNCRRRGQSERVEFLHADIHALPFPDGFLDFVNCDQVIHHTPDPRMAFEALSRKLRRGGDICCYVYRKKAAVREFTDDYVRDKIRALPVKEALKVCEPITKLGRSLASLKITVDVEEDIPLLGIKKGPIDLQRFFHWNVLKCFWNDEFDFFTNNVVNFDWYHPENCHRFEPSEFRAWFAQGWEIQAWDVQEAGISCRARKT
ncbi:MAG: class I SAM-dependent methyltransferase [Planctomycetota bacterium]